MAKRKYSVSEIAGIVESEGLGYTVQHGISAGSIKDEDLADMWTEAKELLADIASYIDDNADDVDDASEDDEEDEDY